MFAVDPTMEVAREAATWSADLLVVHHPLFLKPVHGFAATTPKGRTLATLAGADCALLTAHTNADQAVGGVSEAMAVALGLTDLAPILPAPQAPMDKLTVFVPAPDAERLRAVLADVGAGRIGNYDQASFSAPGEGRFRPLEGADPTIGTVGTAEVVDEVRIEVVLPRGLRADRRVRDGRGPPLRDPGVRRGRAGRPAGGRHRHRTDRLRGSDDPARLRRHGRRRRCRRRPVGCGWRATRTGRSGGWRCAGERATSCSMRSPRPTPMSTSRAT